MNIQTISRLSALTRHRQWGGSTAFSQDAASQMFSRTFRSLSLGANSNNEIHKTLKDSLAFLEALKPGITENIAWDEIVTSSE
ncbi:MAG: hypothetical protein CUN54_10120 [Phototrophicales bacterium]|nr:MAG: hypothetical protein CUN54_10120 [Phototrophicales bacterium]